MATPWTESDPIPGALLRSGTEKRCVPFVMSHTSIGPAPCSQVAATPPPAVTAFADLILPVGVNRATSRRVAGSHKVGGDPGTTRTDRGPAAVLSVTARAIDVDGIAPRPSMGRLSHTIASPPAPSGDGSPAVRASRTTTRPPRPDAVNQRPSELSSTRVDTAGSITRRCELHSA